MGVVLSEVVFDGQAPGLSAVADKVTELSGLPLSVADLEGDWYDLHARLTFACAPETHLEVHAYRPGAVKELYRQTFGDSDLPIARYVQGLNEPAGTQAVYLRGYIGQEPTLWLVTLLALEALGGRLRRPIADEDRRRYGTPVTPAQLEERQRETARRMRPIAVVVLLLLPLLIPLWLIAFVLLMPWRIWKVYQLYRSYTEGRGEAGRTRRGA
jgi:hypothetical protein